MLSGTATGPPPKSKLGGELSSADAKRTSLSESSNGVLTPCLMNIVSGNGLVI